MSHQPAMTAAHRLGALLCLALTMGCTPATPNTAEPNDSAGSQVREIDPPAPSQDSSTPEPPSAYPPPERPDGPNDDADDLESWPPAEAYPGGARPTRPPTASAAERTATNVAVRATSSAAQDSLSAAIAGVLPAGATFDIEALEDWSGELGPGGKGLPIQLRDGSLDHVALVAASPHDVAGGSEAPYARRVWQMTETVPVTDVTAIRKVGLTWPDHDAAGLQVDAGGSTWLVVASFATDAASPRIQEAFALPGVLTASRSSERVEHSLMRWESEATGLLVGSTRIDRETDAVHRSLTVHQAPSGGVASRIGSFGPGAVVRDMDGDGSPEIVAAASTSGHEVWRLAADGLVGVRVLPADDLPAPETVRVGALPPLPADLFFYRLAGQGEVWRWPATGSALQRIGPVQGMRTESGMELRLAAPHSEEAIRAGRPPYQVARDAPVVVYALASQSAADRAIALGFHDLAADSWQVVAITGTLGAWSVAPDGRSALYLGRGALSGASRTRNAEDAGLFLVTPGKAQETRLVARCESVSPGPPYGSLGCSSFAADASWSNVAYGDGHGVWTLPMEGGTPRRLLEHQLAETDAAIFDTHVYRPIKWSPDGNWLFLHAGRYEGSTGALLNLQTGGVIDLAEVGRGIESGSTLDFGPDSSQVGITRFGQYRTRAAVSLFELATRTDRGFLEGEPITGSYRGSSGVFTPDGRFRFGSWSVFRDRYQADGLFELDPLTGAVRRLAPGLASLDPELVAGSALPELVWSPDAEAFALAGTTSGPGWFTGALVGTETETHDASEVLSRAGYLQWSRLGR